MITDSLNVVIVRKLFGNNHTLCRFRLLLRGQIRVFDVFIHWLAGFLIIKNAVLNFCSVRFQSGVCVLSALVVVLAFRVFLHFGQLAPVLLGNVFCPRLIFFLAVEFVIFPGKTCGGFQFGFFLRPVIIWSALKSAVMGL